MCAKGPAQILNKVKHFLLGRLREILCHIQLAYSFTHCRLCHRQRTLPQRTLLLDTAHHFAELKRSISEIGTEIRSRLCHIFPKIIIFLLAWRKRSKKIIGTLHRVDLSHNYLVERIDAHRLDKEAIPVDYRIHLFKLCERTRIFHRGNITAFLKTPCFFGKRCLDFHHIFHNAFRIPGTITSIDHLLTDQGAVGVAYRRIALVVEQIIIAVAKTDTTATHIHGIGIAVVKILHWTCIEKRTAMFRMHPHEKISHSIIILGTFLNLTQIGKYR